MTTRRPSEDHLEKMTSDQIAGLAGHPAPVILEWVRDGKLPAHREPGSGARWFARNELQVLEKGKSGTSMEHPALRDTRWA